MVVLLAGLVGGGAAVQLGRALPVATFTPEIASTLTVPGTPATFPWPRQGSAELVVDGYGRLGGHGGGAPKAIGSVAKVMTAYVILKNHPLADGKPGPSIPVTRADVDDYRGRIASGQSLVPMQAGTSLTQRDALEALLLPSANNVAHLLAVWDAGSEKAFVARMNEAARSLGMKDTTYTDPSGYLPTTVSTAADQVLLGQAALDMPALTSIAALKKASMPVAGAIRNYNDLLGVDGVVGIKTGSTTEAGGNLLFASKLTVDRTTVTVVGAVFNQPGEGTPAQLAQVNKVVRQLLAEVRATVRIYELLPGIQPVGTVRTAWGDTSTVRPASSLRVLGWPGLAVPVRVTTAAAGPAVGAGQTVGAVQARDVRVDLLADRTTGGPDLWWKLSRR